VSRGGGGEGGVGVSVSEVRNWRAGRGMWGERGRKVEGRRAVLEGASFVKLCTGDDARTG